MTLKSWLITLVSLTIWSCAPDLDKDKSIGFFDINGLVDEQVKLLESISPSIYKEATINGKMESSTLSPDDSAQWAKELIIFKSADINRSILIDSYQVSKSSKKGNTIITYSSLYPKKTEVDTLTIELGPNQKPAKIRANLDNRNELFDSAKTLEMNFSSKQDTCLLSSFSTKGWQKMISKDTASYQVLATLDF